MTPTEQSAQKPSAMTGLSASLRASVSADGTTAPQAPRTGLQGPPQAVRSAPKGVLALLLTALCLLALAPAVASAAITHSFIPGLSAKLTANVPAQSGVNASAFDQGHLWLAEKTEGTSETRVDEFDAVTGARLLQFPTSFAIAGIAVGHSTGAGQVYAGTGSGVAVFGEEGTSLATWSGEDTPGGVEGFAGGVTGVAVDSSALDSAHGDVYVADSAPQKVIDVFEPEAGGGEKYLTQLNGTCATGMACEPAEAFVSPHGVAVDSASGDVLVADETAVDVFEPEPGLGHTYKFLFKITAGPNSSFKQLKGVAVDASSGEIYVWGNEEHAGSELVDTFVDLFSATGKYEGRLTETSNGPFNGVQSVAVNDEAGSASFEDLYVGDVNTGQNVGVLDVFGPALVIPDVATEPVITPRPLSATVKGTVNPDGLPVTSCEFEYGTSTSYGKTAACEHADAEEIGSGVAAVPVEAQLKGLSSGTTYHFRLLAGNANGSNATQDETFPTTGPGIESEFASDVASTSATLGASINPDGTPTSYYFQYATTGSFADAISIPAAPGVAIGSGKVPVEVAPQHVQGLSPGRVYHYRVVAVSELEGTRQTFAGPDQTFTTQTAGSFALPDERQWELVSPPDKHGALIEPSVRGQVTQAAAAGNAFTFLTDAPTEAQPQGYANFVQILAGRGAAGWEPKDIAPPHGGATGVTTSNQEYRFFSPDLSASILQQVGPFTPLSEAASEQTAYLRNDTNGTYTPLVTPANDTAKPFQPFGEEGACPHGKEFCGPEFVGATPDLKHVVLASNVALTPNANSGSLYEWSNGSLSLVSVLPGGEPAEAHLGGEEGRMVRGAISADGSRIVWSEKNGAQHLFMRDVARGETVELDAVQSGTGPGEVRPVFQAASADGSTVYFTDSQALTKSASVGGFQKGDLYRCEMVVEAGKLACHLSDLTPAGAGGEPASVLDLLPGVSEDGSRVYFVADGVLAPGAVHGNLNYQGVPHGGLTNLYTWHAGVTTLVAVLSSEDYPDWNGTGGPDELAALASRVSPDGHWLAFTSQRPLTGYDSRDVVTGNPDEEVYLYDAEHQRLVCASCNPTRARPRGAGSVPPWTTYTNAAALYQSRYLSNEGRLFFNSSDALVPADINATGDVYQYEPAGIPAGSHACSPSVGSGSDVYKPARVFEVDGRSGEEGAGCVGLISSGSSPQESGFLDASESGGDVFFFTSSRLSPQDFDTSPDVYDAHECSTAAPCYPQAAAVQSPPCDTGDSCRAAPTPQPSIFGAPASATFSGPGNSTPPPAVVKPKTAEQIRVEKLNKALKACRTKHNRHKRQTCERQARKRYGPTKAKKASHTTTTHKGGK